MNRYKLFLYIDIDILGWIRWRLKFQAGYHLDTIRDALYVGNSKNSPLTKSSLGSTDPSIVSTTWGACVLNFVSLRALGERGNGRNKLMDEKLKYSIAKNKKSSKTQTGFTLIKNWSINVLSLWNCVRCLILCAKIRWALIENVYHFETNDS